MDPKPRSSRGRFEKKSGAGAHADAESPGTDPERTGEGLGAGSGEILVAHLDRPGLTVDESAAQLEADAHAALAGAPLEIEAPAPDGAPGTPGPGPSEEEVLAGYTLICTEVVDLGAGALVPAWKVTPAESGKMAGAIARALLLWFPDMIIPPKYLALLSIAGVAFEIAQARRDATGRYLPARLPEKPAGEGAPAASH